MNHSVLKSLNLGNGLTVRVYDNSRRYYGDFHLVRLEFVCSIPVERYLRDFDDPTAVRKTLGPAVEYRKAVEKMGIPGAQVDTVKEEMLRNFSDVSIQYMSRESFPARYIRSEMSKRKRR